MRKITLWSILCLLACLQAGAQDRSTPEATVRSFLTAFGSGDMKQVAACVKGANLSGPALDSLVQQIKKDPATITLSDAKTTITGASAVLTGQVSMKAAKMEKAESGPTQLNLEQADGAWLIVPDVARVKAGGNMPDMVNMLAYVMTDTQTFTRARDAARTVSCLSNVKQICLGALMFCQDYDEVYKLKAETYKKSLMPYIKSEAVFKCPADTGPGNSYSFNGYLAGVSLAKIQAPAKTVLIYEGKNGKLDFRHGGKAAVGFADGHAKDVSQEEAKNLRWKP